MKKSKSLFNPFSFCGVPSSKGNHSFANSYLRLQYTNLLKVEDYEKLCEQETTEDILKIFRESYDYDFSSLASLKEDLLKNRMKSLHFIINSIGKRVYGSQSPSLIEEFFRLPLDFFNLKVLFKGQMEHRNWDQFPFSEQGFLSIKQLESLYQEVPLGFLRSSLKKSLNHFQRWPKNERTSYQMDVFWDNQLHEFYGDLLKKLGSEIVTALYMLKLDIKNILSTMRLKKAGKSEEDLHMTIQHLGNIRRDILVTLFHTEFENIPEQLAFTSYGKEISVGLEAFKSTENFSSLEKHLEEFWLRSCHRFISLSYNEDLAIIYHWLQQNEHSNIQTVLSGKQNGMSHSWILSHLRVVL